MKPTAFAAVLALTLPFMATSAQAETVSTQDFVNKVAISDMFEVQSGKLASDKAKNEDIRDFGEQMVDDHTATTEDLKELVEDEDLKVELPTALDKKHQADLDKLQNASGAQFDETYVPMQVIAHESAVNLFEDYSKSGDNEALKEWASDTLPTLKEHLEDARELNEELSKPAKTAAADDATADDEKARVKAAANDGKAKEKVAPPPFKYVKQQASTDWTAQALIGRTVKNENNEILGEINNVILNEKGKVVAVTIGVGGFLGLGEKDVGVPFEALKFRSEEALEKKADADDEDTTSAADNEVGEYDDPAHSDIVIVVDATKEQLEAAPDFVWLGEKKKTEKRADAETDKSVK